MKKIIHSIKMKFIEFNTNIQLNLFYKQKSTQDNFVNKLIDMKITQQLNFQMGNEMLINYIENISGIFNIKNSIDTIKSILTDESTFTKSGTTFNDRILDLKTNIFISKNNIDLLSTNNIINQIKLFATNTDCNNKLIFLQNESNGKSIVHRSKLSGKLYLKKYTEISYNSNINNNFDVIKIENSDDVKSFIDDVNFFVFNGKYRNVYKLKKILKNSCRWSGKGACSVISNPRIKINSRNEYTNCLDCNKTFKNKNLSKNIRHNQKFHKTNFYGN
ncbi:MAG: hypothetical protein ABF289_15865 [Clostridiales bacterium]